MPHVHFLLGVAVNNILIYLGLIPDDYTIWFILGSLSPDIDIIISYLYKIENHRRLLTHFPIFHLFGILFFGIFQLPIFQIFFVGTFFHIIVDFLDWGIYPFGPFYDKSFSFVKLNHEKLTKNSTNISFLKYYYQNLKIIVLEALAIIVCSFSLLL